MTNGNNYIYRLLNISLAFGLICLFSSYLPHWPEISFHVWINEFLFFALFLLSASIVLKDKNNKDIFFNFCILFLFNSFSFLNIFIGENYLFGNNNLAWYIFTYKTIVLCYLWIFNIFYIFIKYIFPSKSTSFRYLITFLIIIPTFVFNFYSYLVKPEFLLNLGDSYLPDLNRRILISYGLPFISILFYGYALYKKDKVLGTYINTIMAMLFIILTTSIINALSIVYNFQVVSFMQYLITINHFCLFIILLKKLLFLRTDFGQFYESVISKKGQIGKVRIQRHNASPNSILIHFLLNYLYHRRNYLFLLLFIASIGIYYLHSPRYFIVNILAIFICIFIIINFINILYKRRAKSKYIIS